MFEAPLAILRELLDRGGWVMWPLLALSVISLMLIFERCWFWIKTNNPARLARYRKVAVLLHQGERHKAVELIQYDRSVYGIVAQRLLSGSGGAAVAVEAIESQRTQIERFMPTLGTIITAAPMLGILGTVTGIIAAFRVLSETDAVTDPSRIGAGIAEALLTTVVGLVIAIVVLFPFNAFRAQIDRTFGRLESLAAAAQ